MPHWIFEIEFYNLELGFEIGDPENPWLSVDEGNQVNEKYLQGAKRSQNVEFNFFTAQGTAGH